MWISTTSGCRRICLLGGLWPANLTFYPPLLKFKVYCRWIYLKLPRIRFLPGIAAEPTGLDCLKYKIHAIWCEKKCLFQTATYHIHNSESLQSQPVWSIVGDFFCWCIALMGKMTILHSFTVIQNVVVVKRGKAEAFCWLCQMCSVWVQAFAFSMQPPQHLDFAYEWLSGGFGRSPTLNCARPQNFAVLAKQRISRSFTSWILRTSRFKMAIMDAAN